MTHREICIGNPKRLLNVFTDCKHMFTFFLPTQKTIIYKLFMETIKHLLMSEYQTRKNKNSRYSLRSYANNLNISPATLSMVLSGKRKLSKEKVLEISKKLGLSPAAALRIIESEILNFEKNLSEQEKHKKNLTEANFQLIANWHHYAIISLSKIKKHKADTRWISRQLGISEMDARDALNRLIELELIEIHNDKIIELNHSSSTTEDVPSEAIRNFHKGILTKAVISIDEVDPLSREISSTILSFNKKDILSAKQSLRDFQEHFANKFESTKNADEVYALTLQFFPLSSLKTDLQPKRDI